MGTTVHTWYSCWHKIKLGEYVFCGSRCTIDWYLVVPIVTIQLVGFFGFSQFRFRYPEINNKSQRYIFKADNQTLVANISGLGVRNPQKHNVYRMYV